MKFTITKVNTDIVDGEIAGAQVVYTMHNENYTSTMNGFVPLTKEEYVGNEDLKVLAKIVRNKIVADVQSVDAGK